MKEDRKSWRTIQEEVEIVENTWTGLNTIAGNKVDRRCFMEAL
jgi:hypothetical protein